MNNGNDIKGLSVISKTAIPTPDSFGLGKGWQYETKRTKSNVQYKIFYAPD